jgi:chromosome transmission fidelity protein 18
VSFPEISFDKPMDSLFLGKVPTDFFGRPIIVKDTLSKKSGTNFRVTYHYHEGSSAAVRKPVKVAAFL